MRYALSRIVQARARPSAWAGGAHGRHHEAWGLVAEARDVRQEARVHESGRLHGPPPLLGREEAAARTIERMQPRRSEGLGEIEHELRLDGLPRARAHAPGDDETTAGLGDLE